jgi:hypothetical protein
MDMIMSSIHIGRHVMKRFIKRNNKIIRVSMTTSARVIAAIVDVIERMKDPSVVSTAFKLLDESWGIFTTAPKAQFGDSRDLVINHFYWAIIMHVSEMFCKGVLKRMPNDLIVHQERKDDALKEASKVYLEGLAGKDNFFMVSNSDETKWGPTHLPFAFYNMTRHVWKSLGDNIDSFQHVVCMVQSCKKLVVPSAVWSRVYSILAFKGISIEKDGHENRWIYKTNKGIELFPEDISEGIPENMVPIVRDLIPNGISYQVSHNHMQQGIMGFMSTLCMMGSIMFNISVSTSYGIHHSEYRSSDDSSRLMRVEDHCDVDSVLSDLGKVLDPKSKKIKWRSELEMITSVSCMYLVVNRCCNVTKSAKEFQSRMLFEVYSTFRSKGYIVGTIKKESAIMTFKNDPSPTMNIMVQYNLARDAYLSGSDLLSVSMSNMLRNYETFETMPRRLRDMSFEDTLRMPACFNPRFRVSSAALLKGFSGMELEKCVNNLRAVKNMIETGREDEISLALAVTASLNYITVSTVELNTAAKAMLPYEDPYQIPKTLMEKKTADIMKEFKDRSEANKSRSSRSLLELMSMNQKARNLDDVSSKLSQAFSSVSMRKSFGVFSSANNTESLAKSQAGYYVKNLRHVDGPKKVFWGETKMSVADVGKWSVNMDGLDTDALDTTLELLESLIPEATYTGAEVSLASKNMTMVSIPRQNHLNLYRKKIIGTWSHSSMVHDVGVIVAFIIDSTLTLNSEYVRSGEQLSNDSVVFQACYPKVYQFIKGHKDFYMDGEVNDEVHKQILKIVDFLRNSPKKDEVVFVRTAFNTEPESIAKDIVCNKVIDGVYYRVDRRMPIIEDSIINMMEKTELLEKLTVLNELKLNPYNTQAVLHRMIGNNNELIEKILREGTTARSQYDNKVLRMISRFMNIGANDSDLIRGGVVLRNSFGGDKSFQTFQVEILNRGLMSVLYTGKDMTNITVETNLNGDDFKHSIRHLLESQDKPSPKTVAELIDRMVDASGKQVVYIGRVGEDDIGISKIRLRDGWKAVRITDSIVRGDVNTEVALDMTPKISSSSAGLKFGFACHTSNVEDTIIDLKEKLLELNTTISKEDLDKIVPNKIITNDRTVAIIKNSRKVRVQNVIEVVKIVENIHAISDISRAEDYSATMRIQDIDMLSKLAKSTEMEFQRADDKGFWVNIYTMTRRSGTPMDNFISYLSQPESDQLACQHILPYVLTELSKKDEIAGSIRDLQKVLRSSLEDVTGNIHRVRNFIKSTDSSMTINSPSYVMDIAKTKDRSYEIAIKSFTPDDEMLRTVSSLKFLQGDEIMRKFLGVYEVEGLMRKRKENEKYSKLTKRYKGLSDLYNVKKQFENPRGKIILRMKRLNMNLVISLILHNSVSKLLAMEEAAGLTYYLGTSDISKIPVPDAESEDSEYEQIGDDDYLLEEARTNNDMEDDMYFRNLKGIIKDENVLLTIAKLRVRNQATFRIEEREMDIKNVIYPEDDEISDDDEWNDVPDEVPNIDDKFNHLNTIGDWSEEMEAMDLINERSADKTYEEEYPALSMEEMQEADNQARWPVETAQDRYESDFPVLGEQNDIGNV